MAKYFSHRRWADKVYNPDTDLDNVRNRVVGILLGLVVTGLIFNYIWPEKARIAVRGHELYGGRR